MTAYVMPRGSRVAQPVVVKNVVSRRELKKRARQQAIARGMQHPKVFTSMPAPTFDCQRGCWRDILGQYFRPGVTEILIPVKGEPPTGWCEEPEPLVYH